MEKVERLAWLSGLSEETLWLFGRVVRAMRDADSMHP
jgi:hypothetical protein